MQRRDTDLLIRLEDVVTVTSAEELKSLLLEGLVSGRVVHLDLERAEEIDVTVLQLLWAARREADRKGTRIVIRVSNPVAAAARGVGFERFPGTAVQE
jgi:anti-anti-sigma regulatory factor